MKNTITQSVLIILLVFSSELAIGQSGKTFSIIVDQDFFYILNKKKNQDRNYTQGTSLTVSNPEFRNSWLFLPFTLLKELSNHTEAHNERTPIMSSIGAIGTAFTPRIIDSLNPIVGDRPFAFLLALSTNQINLIGDKIGNNSSYESITINYGLLGTQLGYNFQSFAHKSIVKGRPTNPKGWNTQLSKGGIPTFLLNYERMRCFTTQKDASVSSSFGLEGMLSVGGSVGYYTRLYSGLYIRAGWINPLKKTSWAVNGNGISTADKVYSHKVNKLINSSADNSESEETKPACELFLFSKLTINLMARNAFLVGQLWNTNTNEYRLDPAWVNVAIMDFDFGLGITITICDRPLNLFFKQTSRSPEFNSRIFPERWHYFGSVGLNFPIK